MLSEERVTVFHQSLALFRRNKLISYRTCLRLLGLMASSTSVNPFALLRMSASLLRTGGSQLVEKSSDPQDGGSRGHFREEHFNDRHISHWVGCSVRRQIGQWGLADMALQQT